MSTSGSSSPDQRPADRVNRKDFALGNMADDLLELTLTMCGKDEHRTPRFPALLYNGYVSEIIGAAVTIHKDIIVANEMRLGENRTAKQAAESYHGWREHASRGDCGNMVKAMDKRYAEALRKAGYRLIITKKRVIICREPSQISHQGKSCTSTRP